jgi:DNA modification methylase
MQIKEVAVNKLIPYAKNSRTHSPEQVGQIAASIKEFGFRNPILVDGVGIIAGHGRLLAAQKLGLDKVPTLDCSDMTDSQKKAYIIADNKLALNAGWDTAMLTIELQDLEDEGFDLTLTGFDNKELDALLNVIEGTDGLTDEDAVPDVPEEPKTKLGDIYILGNHRLMCGDSTSIDAVEKLLEGQKADLLFTDPPYGVSYEGGHNKKKRQGIIADTLQGEDLTDLFYESLSTAITWLKDGAAMYVWYASGKSIETYASLAKLPLKLRAVIQWYKIKSGLGAFMSQYIPNCEPCMYLHKEGCSPSWYGPTNEKTVWELKKESTNSYHPTQKPVELPERAITNSTKQGDSVLDLFGGSGSTLIACEKIGRLARVMELDPKYCDVIVKRWEDFTGKQAILAEL